MTIPLLSAGLIQIQSVRPLKLNGPIGVILRQKAQSRDDRASPPPISDKHRHLVQPSRRIPFLI